MGAKKATNNIGQGKRKIVRTVEVKKEIITKYENKKEKTLPAGYKRMKDRQTLLLCDNASGDFKVKPKLAYHSNNQKVFEINK